MMSDQSFVFLLPKDIRRYSNMHTHLHTHLQHTITSLQGSCARGCVGKFEKVCCCCVAVERHSWSATVSVQPFEHYPHQKQDHCRAHGTASTCCSPCCPGIGPCCIAQCYISHVACCLSCVRTATDKPRGAGCVFSLAAAAAGHDVTAAGPSSACSTRAHAAAPSHAGSFAAAAGGLAAAGVGNAAAKTDEDSPARQWGTRPAATTPNVMNVGAVGMCLHVVWQARMVTAPRSNPFNQPAGWQW